MYKKLIAALFSTTCIASALFAGADDQTTDVADSAPNEEVRTQPVVE